MKRCTATLLTKSRVANEGATPNEGKKRKTAVGHIMCFMSLNDTRDRFVNEPDNMIQQRMPSIILNSYKCFFLLIRISVVSHFGFHQWMRKKLRTALKLFLLHLIYFLKSLSRFVASILLLVIFFVLHHHRHSGYPGCHGT